MSNIKQLAGQTLWYGGSSILARFLNYLLTPYLTYKLSGSGYGEMSMIYASIPFLNVVFTYGIETAFFRFSGGKNNKDDVFSTASISIIVTTILLSGMLFLFRDDLQSILKLTSHPEFIIYLIIIIALDTLTTLPYAQLRLLGKPKKFALVRVTNIAVTIFFTYFFISILPRVVAEKPNGFLALIYIENYEVGYVILANVIASFVQFLQLSSVFFSFKLKFNKLLWNQMIIYSLPLLIVGFGGMINEVADRIMLGWWAPAATDQAKKFEVGIYSACYKLSILITLFIQGFRMGAEPFFFKQADEKNPQRTYARVMKFFVITICIMFLVVALYLDIWKYFIRNEKLWAGLTIVPILLLANMFLGMYYNLSIWYKLSNKTMYGAYITLAGAAVTLAINYFFIPYYSYVACAWATFFSYGVMMVISYYWGQKVYPIPYAVKKIVTYLLLAVAIYFIQKLFGLFIKNEFILMGIGTIFLLAYLGFIALLEQHELGKLPVVGKYFLKTRKTPDDI